MARIDAPQYQAGSRLYRGTARRLQRPGEEGAVGVDPHRVRQAVDGETTDPQRTGGLPRRTESSDGQFRRSGHTARTGPNRPARCGGAGSDTGRGGQEGASAKAAHGDPAPDPMVRTTFCVVSA